MTFLSAGFVLFDTPAVAGDHPTSVHPTAKAKKTEDKGSGHSVSAEKKAEEAKADHKGFGSEHPKADHPK